MNKRTAERIKLVRNTDRGKTGARMPTVEQRHKRVTTRSITHGSEGTCNHSDYMYRQPANETNRRQSKILSHSDFMDRQHMITKRADAVDRAPNVPSTRYFSGVFAMLQCATRGALCVCSRGPGGGVGRPPGNQRGCPVGDQKGNPSTSSTN